MTEEKVGRNPKFWEALLLLVVMIFLLLYCVVFNKTGAQVPLFFCTILATLFALYLGYNFKSIEKMIFSGLQIGQVALLFNVFIGLIIASWIAAGIMPYIIYLGLGWFSPAWVAVIACVICALMSTIIGSSWTTAGTVGLAFVGIAMGMGLPAAFIAGAVISGSTFGDKLSPLSETTVLAAAVSKTELMQHVHSMLYTSLPSLVIGIIIYAIMGIKFGGGAYDLSQIEGIRTTLSATFKFSPLLFIIPIILIVMMLKKIDSMFCLGVAVIMGVLVAGFYQGHNLTSTASYLMNGLGSEVTNNILVNQMIKKGGLNSMWFTISLILISMPLAGILHETNVLKVLVNKFSFIAKSPAAAISTALAMPAVLTTSCGASYVPAILTATAFGDVFDNLEIDRKVLSRTIEDTGTLFSAFVPWHGAGVYYTTTLGVTTLEYAPYYLLGFIDPLVALLCAFTGWGIFYTNGRRGWGKKNRYVKPVKDSVNTQTV